MNIFSSFASLIYLPVKLVIIRCGKNDEGPFQVALPVGPFSIIETIGIRLLEAVELMIVFRGYNRYEGVIIQAGRGFFARQRTRRR